MHHEYMDCGICPNDGDCMNCEHAEVSDLEDIDIFDCAYFMKTFLKERKIDEITIQKDGSITITLFGKSNQSIIRKTISYETVREGKNGAITSLVESMRYELCNSESEVKNDCRDY